MQNNKLNLYQLSLGPVNAFLINHKGDLTLIDTGFEKSKNKIYKALQKLDFKPEQIKRIILTHPHPDHAGAASAIQNELQIPVWMHEDDAVLLRQGIAGREKNLSPGIVNYFIYHAFIKKSSYKISSCIIEKELQHGEILPLAGDVEIIHTPGHSKGHICLLMKKHKLLIAADLISNMPTLGFSTVYEDRQLGINSLKMVLQNYDFDKICFGHGQAIFSNAKEKIQKAFSKYL